MHPTNSRFHGLKKFTRLILLLGPGIYCMGYTIGTGSVTSMAVAGSSYGMTLLWVLGLSCFFSIIMIEVSGRFAAVTGKGILFAVRKEILWGNLLSWLIIAGIVVAQWCAITGILGLCSNLFYQVLRMLIPSLPVESHTGTIIIALIIITVIYSFLYVGRYDFFEKVLVTMVSLMAIAFLTTLILVPVPLDLVWEGFRFKLPQEEGGLIMGAAFVGTTMAAATFIVRPLLIKGKGWGIDHVKTQRRDAVFAGVLMFVVSAAIMGVATAGLYLQGRKIGSVIDMLALLEPLAGMVGSVIFVLGTLCAGLSSIFPASMILPIMLADREEGNLDTSSPRFRRLALVACLFGMIVPILGWNPVIAQIVTQIAGVFILPLSVLCIAILVFNKKFMGTHAPGWKGKVFIALAFFFACCASVAGVIALMKYF